MLRRLGEALDSQGVSLSPESAAIPGANLVILGDGLSPRVTEAISRGRANGAGCVLVLDQRSGRMPPVAAWQALLAGADDVLSWDGTLVAAEAIASRLRRVAEIAGFLKLPVVRDHLVGNSRAWQATLREVVEAARFTDSAILLTGETGTGKELVARLIHTLDARPDKGELIVLDCTTVVPDLAGSEFFGHERGAFTHAVLQRDGAFALADRGTLFLDEVGELPASLQAELLRVVQEKAYKRIGSNAWRQTNFRLVCATHRDLATHAGNGEFRADFYHRIASWTIRLPPLRARRDDVLPLARHFAVEALGEGWKGRRAFDSAIEDLLLAREYPGNVRELRQLVLRMAKRHVGPPPITAGDIPEADRTEARGVLSRDWSDGSLEAVLRRALGSGAGLREIKERAAEVVIRLALQDAGGNVQQAALRLGVTDRALQLRRAAHRGDRGAPAEPAADAG